MEANETYCLSIGRLFHKISLSGNSITVTRYRPRHPYPGFNYQYRYRFHAPHHDTYEESYASFTTEKLEHFNWNYLDHYICTRGDTDFVLVDALKYWRFRVYLLPLNNAATKRIIEGASHCDIYTGARSNDHQQIVEGFLKFVETIVNYNKIKRPSKARNNAAVNSPYRERLGSNRIPERPRQRPGFKAIERACWPVDISHDNGPNDPNIEDGNSAQSEPILKSTASHADILEAMKNFDTGVGFLYTHQSLPTYTFVSSEAANWIYSNMEGVSSVDEAVQILKNMHRAQLICHASGDFCKPFYYGFYLYHIVQTSTDDKDYCSPLGDLQTFENEWLEVEIRPALNWGLPLPSANTSVPVGDRIERERCIPHFLCDDIDFNYVMGDSDIDNVYKRMHLEIDISNKSDRVEWGHARYQTVFRPDQSYELVIEWLTASGSIVAEMLSWWMRKAQSCGLQLVPIPHDPLALPYSNKSDPLRGPIFIPLNMKCLEEPELLFKEFREDTTFDRIFLFQEAIISRFGFVKCLVEPTTYGVATVSATGSNTSGITGSAASTAGVAATMSTEHQYIHCTGTIFILISSPASKNRHRLGSASLQQNRHLKVQNTHALGLKIPPGRYSDHADVVPSPHEAYITRHVSGKNKDDYDNSRRMGFLWSWNHMVSKRWRTNQSVDNNFQVKLLRDFREFCANFEDRLRNYWEESWELKESASSTY